MKPIGRRQELTLRQLSPLPQRSVALDSFAPTPEPAGIYSNPGRGLLSGLLVATVAVAACVPQAVQAQNQGLTLLVQSKAAPGQSVPLNEGLQRLKPGARQQLQQLPSDVQQVFVDLEPEAMRWMMDKVNGTTWVAMIPVNNREALISGTALGTDVFAEAISGLKAQIAERAIPAEMEGRLSALLHRLQTLSAAQRTTLVAALESQVK